MRRQKEITIEGHEKPFVAFEIKISDLRDFYLSISERKSEAENFMALESWLPRLINRTFAEIEELYPNELKQIVDAVKEVNSDFFVILKLLGYEPVLKSIIAILPAILTDKLFGLDLKALPPNESSNGDMASS